MKPTRPSKYQRVSLKMQGVEFDTGDETNAERPAKPTGN